MEKKHIFIGDDQTLKWEHEDKLYCLHIMRDDDASNPREVDDWILTTMACWHRDYKLGDDIGKSVSPKEWWQNLVNENVPKEELVKALVGGELTIKAIERSDSKYDIKYKDDDGTWLDGRCCTYERLKDFTVYDLEVEDCMKLLKDYAVWLPLWLYDHSGISMSCSSREYPYNDRWDSGQVGWILMTKLNALTIYDAENRGWQKTAIETMQYEVEMYDEWLEGKCYGYALYVADKPQDGKEPNWGEEEVDSCFGFYGDDIFANGVPLSVGCGLEDALESGDYLVGTAKRHIISYYTF